MIEIFSIYDSARSNGIAYATFFLVANRLVVVTCGEHDTHSQTKVVEGIKDAQDAFSWLKGEFSTEYVFKHLVTAGLWVNQDGTPLLPLVS